MTNQEKIKFVEEMITMLAEGRNAIEEIMRGVDMLDENPEYTGDINELLNGNDIYKCESCEEWEYKEETILVDDNQRLVCMDCK